ncbi:MAG: prolyl oligopeptidase family serine peptidase [Gemmatimonadota bacterium]|jgi:dipeptidyl aminopeptidase/acylaminoacyl peptidase
MPKARAILAAAAVAAASLPNHGAAQSTAAYVPEPVRDQTFQLSIEHIMRGPELVGEAPSDVRWTDDSKWVYFRWLPGGNAWNDDPALYRVEAGGGEPLKLDEDEARDAAPLIAPGDLSPDRRWRVSAVNGDLYLVNRRTMDVRRLTHTEDSEDSPLFNADASAVLFRRGNNLYRLTLADGSLDQITRIESGPAPKESPEPEGQREFLEQQQLELFQHIRRQKEHEEEQKEEREAARADEPEPLYLARDEQLRELVPTRDGRYVLVRTYTPASDAKHTVIPEWITENGYTQDINGRTKVGDEQSGGRLGLITTGTGAVTWLDPTAEGEDTAHPPRVFRTGWDDAGSKAFVFAVSYDNKDRWLWSVDAATGEKTLLDHLHDDAWVGGPCFGRCVGFVPGTDRVWYVSEKTGYAHLWAVNADGTGKEQLTSGEWEVLGVSIPEDHSRFLLTTNEGSPFNQRVSWMDFDGSDLRPVTEGDGRYEATPSPDGKRFAFVHDVANHPPELYLAQERHPTDMAKVTESPTKAWDSFPWLKPEIIHFRASDGTMVPARIYRPVDMGAQANGAGVVFVHGAGYLHNVHNYWSSYYREYMFNQFLAASGYTVLDIDYRGSAGYGRDWRTAIYEWMGGKDLSDQVDGAHYLVANEGVDAARIGIYGGSYGGFMTLMALFTADDTFRSGAALRSVTDWAHYNHGYTSDILNLPQNDSTAYQKSSPIYFAQNLRPDQHLLILHGMVDTNVHFSDVVRLTQRLIELGKENWEIQPYPVENHGFVEPTSWTDEYRRIFELFEGTIRNPGCGVNGGSCAPRRAAAAGG